MNDFGEDGRSCGPDEARERVMTDLHYAAEAGDLRRAAELLVAGADPNAQNPAGSTPLHLSIDSEADPDLDAELVDTAMTHLLLAFGADPNLPDDNGETATDWAASIPHPGAARIIRIIDEEAKRSSG